MVQVQARTSIGMEAFTEGDALTIHARAEDIDFGERFDRRAANRQEIKIVFCDGHNGRSG